MTCIESGGLEIVQMRPVVPTALRATFRITGIRHCVPEVDSLGDARNAPMAVAVASFATTPHGTHRFARPTRPDRDLSPTHRAEGLRKPIESPVAPARVFARTLHDVVGRSSEDKFRSPTEDVVKGGGWSGIGVPPMQ